MLEVGDKVRYIRKDSEFIEYGAIGIVNNISEHGLFWADWDKANKGPYGDKIWGAIANEIELVKEESMLNVGDKVKITGVNLGKANNYIGKEGVVHTIVGMNDSYGNYVSVKGIKMKSGTFSSWFPTKSLEKIEPEERELKFKVGEQVKIIGYSNLGYDTGTVGEIGIVENVKNVDGDTPYWVTSKSNHTGLFYGEESLEKVTIEEGDEEKKPESPDITLISSDSFYCCYVEGTGAFYKKHTESEARKECERLTNKEHRKVYLMKAIEVCEVPVKPVEWNKL